MTAFEPVRVGTAVAPRVLAAVCDDATRSVVEAVLAARGGLVQIIDGGAAGALACIAAGAPPRLLIVDLGDSADPVAAIDALADVCLAGTPVVVLGAINDIALFRALTALGIADYLVKPVAADALAAALDRATAGSAPAGQARVVALIGARGGVGTTTLALASAWLLRTDARVTLLDLDLHFGGAALALDSVPAAGLRNLLGAPDRLDGLLVDSAQTVIAPGLALLAAEAGLEHDAVVDPQGLAVLLAALGESTDLVIVDVPRRLDAATRMLLRTADCVGIVTDFGLAGLRDTARLLKLITGLRAGARPLVIANRMGAADGQLPRAEFERGIGGAIDFAIADDVPGAAAAAARAKPLSAVGAAPRTLDQLQALAAVLGARTAHAHAASNCRDRLRWRDRLRALFDRLQT
jgi:pilus assembly protein CpaE